MQCEAYQDRFTWHLIDDAPLTEVIELGGIPYAACCALCGGFHELARPAATDGLVMDPQCPAKREHGAVPGHLKLAYQRWLEQWPQAVEFEQIYVTIVTLGEHYEQPFVQRSTVAYSDLETASAT